MKSKFALFIALASGVSCAHAQTQTPSPFQNTRAEPAVLNVVTVTAGRGSSLGDMPVSTTVLGHEEVQSMPESSVDQLINKIPGIFTQTIPATQLHPTGQPFNIRGFGTTTNINTLVMVDGVPFNDPYFRTVNWSRIPKSSIESVEVIRGGGATALWGNMAMGGVVNIVTTEPEPGDANAYFSVGSYASMNYGASGTLFATDKIKMGINLDRATSNGYNQTPSEYRNSYMTATSSIVNNVGLSTYFTPTADSKYYVKLSANQTQENTATWDVASNKWNSYTINAGGRTRFADESSVNVSAFYTSQQFDTTNASLTPAFNIFTPQIGVPYVSQQETANYSSLGGTVFFQRDFGQLKDVKIGVDARRITSIDDVNQYGVPVRGVSTQTANIVSSGQNDFQGVFATGTYRFDVLPLDMNLGLRQDFWQASNASLDGTVMTPGGGAFNIPLANNNFSSFDPNLGVKYHVNDNFDLRGSVYRNFAAPGMNMLYRSFLSGASLTTANPLLTPQTNFGQELGFDLRTTQKDASMSVTFFNNKMRNYIDYAALCTSAAQCNPMISGTGLAQNSITRLSQYVNAGDAVFRGFEVLGQLKATKTLQLTGGFTRTQAYLSTSDYTTPAATPPDPTNAQLGQVPPWMLNLGASWQATADLNVSAQVKSFPDFWNNTGHTQLNQGATLVDLGFSYQVNKKVNVYGAVQNLFNVNYLAQGMTYTTYQGNTVSSSGVPALGMPRWFTLGMRATF